MFIFFGWEIILITGTNFSCHGYRLYIFYVLHSLLEYPVVFTLRILIFANLMKKIFANIYFCEPVIGKVSPTFIFANQRKIYRILKMFAIFSIKTCRMNENKTDGHLPREISRSTKFLPRQRSKRNSFIFNPLPKVSFFPGRFRDSWYHKGLLHCQHQNWYVDQKVKK